jgi:hypothetical protein
LNNQLNGNTLRIVKGYTRATAAMFVLLAAADMDLSEDGAWSALETLAPVLDHAMIVPVVLSVIDDTKALHFRSMELSLKGSERQRPNIFAQTMRFMDILTNAGQPVTDTGLCKLIDEFNRMPAVATNKKWQIGKDARVAIVNISSGVAPDTLSIIKHHLHNWKWAECGACAVKSRCMCNTRCQLP